MRKRVRYTGRLLLVLGGKFEGEWHPPRKWPRPLLLPGPDELPFGSRQFRTTHVRVSLPRPGAKPDEEGNVETVEVWVWWELDERQAVRRLKAIWPRVKKRLEVTKPAE